MKAKRRNQILNLARNGHESLATVFSNYPGMTFYHSGVRSRSTLSIIMPDSYTEQNPNLLRIQNSEIIEKGTVKPLPVVKKPITLTYAQNVIRKDGKGELKKVDETSGSEAKSMQGNGDNDQPNFPMNTNKVGENDTKNTEEKTNEGEDVQGENGSGCGCLVKKVNECIGKPGPEVEHINDDAIDKESESVLNESGEGLLQDKSADMAAHNTAPLMDVEEKLNEPVPDPRKHKISDETMMKTIMSNTIPLTTEEYNAKLPKKKKLSRTPKFQMID